MRFCLRFLVFSGALVSLYWLLSFSGCLEDPRAEALMHAKGDLGFVEARLANFQTDGTARSQVEEYLARNGFGKHPPALFSCIYTKYCNRHRVLPADLIVVAVWDEEQDDSPLLGFATLLLCHDTSQLYWRGDGIIAGKLDKKKPGTEGAPTNRE